MPAFYKENEQFRFVNKVFFPAAAVIIAFLLSFSGLDYNQYKQIEKDIPLLRSNINDRGYINTDFNNKIDKRLIVDQQLKKMSYDRNYTKRTIEIMKYLSNSTEKVITLSSVRFHYGWQYTLKRMTKGRQLETSHQKDSDTRFATIEGQFVANANLQEQYYNAYKQRLLDSELFYDIKELSKSGMGASQQFKYSLR